MTSGVDPRLVSFLQGVFGFTDTLRDIGMDGGVSVTLNRASGLKLLQLVAGARDAGAEERSQSNRPWKDGLNSLSIAGLVFEWPKPPGSASHPLPANDNSGGHLLRYGFEEEAPALK
ncbi:hypothetical protein [Aestuariivirga sp.]|uniref:hypothetical protein n=1 Tax=Aestuariivirga sp. TaxID=2650926 RepID=UPI003BAC9C28